jgi:hypothetical protein
LVGSARSQLNRRDFMARVLALTAGGIGLTALGTAVVGIGSPGKTFINSVETDPLAILKSPGPNNNQVYDGGSSQLQLKGAFVLQGISGSAFPGNEVWALDAEAGDFYSPGYFILDSANPNAPNKGFVNALIAQGGIGQFGMLRLVFFGSGQDDRWTGPAGGNSPTFTNLPQNMGLDWQAALNRNQRVSTDDAAAILLSSLDPSVVTGSFFLEPTAGSNFDRWAWRSQTPSGILGTPPTLFHAMVIEKDFGGQPTPSPVDAWGDAAVGSSGKIADAAHIHGFKPKVQNIATNLSTTSLSFYVDVDATGAARTVTLHLAVNVPGQIMIITKRDSTANTVTVNRSGGETINGATSKVLTKQYDMLHLQANTELSAVGKWLILSARIDGIPA